MTQVSERQINAYRRSAVSTASPIDLVVMLYDGGLRFLDAARKAIQDHNLEGQHECLTKAQRVVTELSVCLDMEQGGEIAANLMALYGFMNNRLAAANINDDVEPVEEVAKLLGDLRAAWATLQVQQRRQETDAEAA